MRKAERPRDWIARQARPAGGAVTAVVAIACAQSLLQVGSAFVVRSVVDAGISGDGKLPRWGAVFVLTLAVTALLYLVRTVLDNLRLVKPEAAPEECKRALTAAGADFVLELPRGLETRLREQNTGLSAGQLQRIAIARAVLMGRQVLLDECTSALDSQTEPSVLRSLRELGTGAIAITHHPENMDWMEGMGNVVMEDKG